MNRFKYFDQKVVSLDYCSQNKKKIKVFEINKINSLNVIINLKTVLFSTSYIGKASFFIKTITNSKPVFIYSNKNIANLNLRSGFIASIKIDITDTSNVFFFLDNLVNCFSPSTSSFNGFNKSSNNNLELYFKSCIDVAPKEAFFVSLAKLPINIYVGSLFNKK